MGYPQQDISHSIFRSSNAHDTACVLTTAADYGGYGISKRIVMKRIKIMISTLTATSTLNPVVTVYRRVTYASQTNAVAIGTLTIPTGSAVGTVIYKDVGQFQLQPGDQLWFKVTTAGTDASSAAGAGFFAFDFDLEPEEASNETKMIASV